MREPELFTTSLTAGFRVGDITVTRLDKKLLRVEHTEVWVPRSFTARIDRAGLQIVELDVEYIQHERFRCKSVHVIARDGQAVDAAALRVPVAALVFEAIERVCYRQLELADDEWVAFARWCYQELVDPAAVPVETDEIRVGDLFRFPVAIFFLVDRSEYETRVGSHLQELLRGADHSRSGSVSPLQVALEYSRAIEDREGTGRAVADRFGWKLAYATNQIAAARKAGYLPETKQGQPRRFPKRTD